MHTILREGSFRIRDLLLAGIALCAFLPLGLIIGLLLAATQKRVFFTQIRPGRDEKPFRLIKFSTLRDAPPGADEAENQRLRLTPVGRFLRQYSLDEFPQLLNVLKGDMALVGPRPLLMEYLPLYSEAERRRHLLRPGITGWAQIKGRNRLSFKERFAYDLWYIDHRSHLLDLKIMALTALKVLRAENVYASGVDTSAKFDGAN